MDELINKRNALREICKNLRSALDSLDVQDYLSYLSPIDYDRYIHVITSLDVLYGVVNNDYKSVLAVFKRVK